MLLRFILILAIPVSSLAQVANWEPAGMPMHPRDIRCIYNDTVNDLLYVGGYIKPTVVGNDQNQKLCIYDGTSWDCFGSFGGPIEAVIRFGDDLFVGGWFCTINGTPICGMARYDGSNWHPLANWEPIGGGVITNFKVLNGELYALGSFDSIYGKDLHGIAKWTGNDWESVYDFYEGATSTGSGQVYDVVKFQGKLYVAGNFNYNGIVDMAVYDQGEWRDVGGSFYGGFNVITKLQVYKEELYAIGSISKPAGNVGHGIQKWNGQFWTQVGDGTADIDGSQTSAFTNVREMLVHNDYLYVVGPYRWVSGVPAPSGVGRWDGQQWCTDTSYHLQQGADAIGFYHDTLYIGFSRNDSIVNGQQTRCLVKYTGVDIQDSCSKVYPVGFAEQDLQHQSNKLVIYPNPTTGIIRIDGEISLFQFEVFDLIGNSVKSGMTSTRSIDLSSLPQGAYVVRLSGDDIQQAELILKN